MKSMTITVRYGADLNLGAAEFADLDIDATNAAFAAIVAQQLQHAYPDQDVTVTYDRRNAISDVQHLLVEDVDMDAVAETLYTIEARVLAGDYGEYAVEVA